MEREKSSNLVFWPPGNNFSPRAEPSGSTTLPPMPMGPGTTETGGLPVSADSNHFSHDISRMPDNPPKHLGHRRAHSEILTLPDDISFDSDLGVVGGFNGPSFSDETEEDLFSMYFDMDKLNSSSATSATPQSSERPRVRHQHSQSMDGSTTIKPEEASSVDAKKSMSAAKLAELALVDPKRAKRIWANRQSAARSKERKMRYIGELERKVQALQTEATTLSAQLGLMQRDTGGLTAENSELKLRLQTIEQQVHLQDALNEALKEEIQHLRVAMGQNLGNGGPLRSFYGNSQGQGQGQGQAMITAHQFLQLQVQSQKQQHQFQQFQLRQHASNPNPKD